MEIDQNLPNPMAKEDTSKLVRHFISARSGSPIKTGFPSKTVNMKLLTSYSIKLEANYYLIK
jgi:hypothetical protein